ncbi:hypothetical protein NGM10_02100 [Halorussus salilacus]|uniref:helix-turn-helix transcriptional regulator n=1 Tax=Halorussus salilacus TaxID=2953750 RepID=UPI00209EA31C|nr:hypothetical protein [Halorussus salilacus]USZ68543.1 hypothetical protein NGM10_02100 [Halorussus salilacus]
MRRLLAVGLVVVLLVGAVPTAAISGTQPMRGPQATPQTLGAAENFDSVEFHIDVYDNGTAEWTFLYQRTLENDTERQQFEEFADEFNNNSTDLYEGFQRQANELADAGQNATGRTMKAESFSKRAEVVGILEENRGVVRMSFQWSAFAAGEGEDVVIGDVFQGGLYLGPNQSLVIHAGPNLQFASASPEGYEPSGDGLADSESITWQGERDFTDQRPRVKFDPVEQTTTEETTTEEPTTREGGGDGADNATTTSSSAGQAPSGNGSSPLMLFVAAVLVLLGLAAAFAWRQGDFGSLATDDDNPGGGGSAAASAQSATPEPSVSDEELLTDEARVKKLLDENGGRMKQVNIVDETGWSKSKVSMLLSEMEDEGEISKLRVGRENIISLEGHEPDAAGSPLEE